MKELLKYRNIWIAVAMIWIVLYHSGIEISFELLNLIRGYGYGGVDICFFASGVGCYFSLEKDSNPLSFMKRRSRRLLPTYWIFLVFWFLYKGFTSGITFEAIIGNILIVQNFTGLDGAFNWYISGLFLMYILAPYLKLLVDKMDNNLWYTMVLALLLLFSIPFWNSNRYIITIIRIPIFYMGMVFAKRCNENKMLTIKEGVFLGMGMLLGFVLLNVFLLIILVFYGHMVCIGIHLLLLHLVYVYVFHIS